MGVSTDIKNITFGTTGATAAYLGDTLIWPLCHTEEIYGIKASGITNNYILLPFNTSSTLRVEVRFKVLSNNGGILLGGNTGQDNNDYRVFYTGGRYYCDVGNGRVYASRAIAVETFEIGNHYIKDMITGNYVASSAPREAPISQYRVNIGYLEFYWLKAYDGGAMIFDGVAARDCDGYYGIMDKMTGNFYKATENPEGVQEISGMTVFDYIRPLSTPHSGDKNYIWLNFNTTPTLRVIDSCFPLPDKSQPRIGNDSDWVVTTNDDPTKVSHYMFKMGGQTIESDTGLLSEETEYGNYYIKYIHYDRIVASGTTVQNVSLLPFGVNLKQVFFYSLKAYDNGSLIFDGVPAYNGQYYGILDRLTDNFFTAVNPSDVTGGNW